MDDGPVGGGGVAGIWAIERQSSRCEISSSTLAVSFPIWLVAAGAPAAELPSSPTLVASVSFDCALATLQLLSAVLLLLLLSALL